MSADVKKFLSTPKGQLVGAISALGVVWLILILYFGGEFISNLPSADSLEDSRRELKKQQKLLEKAKAEEDEYLNVQIFEVLDFGDHITIEDPHPVME